MATWQEALAADRTVVIDAHTHPEVPPLPPHITWTQARHFMTSILRGDPAAGRMMAQSMKEIAEEFVPHRE